MLQKKKWPTLSMNICMWNFRGLCFTAILNRIIVALLTFATKEAKSKSPRLTWGCAVIKLFEKATEAFTATIGFLLQFSETLFSPSNPALFRHLTEKEEEEEEVEEGRPRPNGLVVRNNLVVAINCSLLVGHVGLVDLYYAM